MGGVAGEAPLDMLDFKKEQTYLSASAYAVFASGLPAIKSKQHRLITSFHGGIGEDLDRFSSLHLPGRLTGFE